MPGHPQQQAGCSELHDMSSKRSTQPASVMFSEPRIANPSSPTMTLDLHEQQALDAREAHRGGPASDVTSLNCSNMFTMNNQFGSFNPAGNGLEQHDSRGNGGRLVPMTQTCTLTSSSAAAYDSKELLEARTRQMAASNVSAAYQVSHEAFVADKVQPVFDRAPASNNDLMRIQDDGSFDEETDRVLEQQRARSLSPQAYVSRRGNGCVQFNDTLNGQRLNRTVVGEARAGLRRSTNAPGNPKASRYDPKMTRLET